LIEFEKMNINSKLPQIKLSIFNLKNYFSFNKKLFAKYLPLALMPIALIFFIPLISFFHPRIEKNRFLPYSLALSAIYIGLAFANKNIIIAIIIPIIFFILGGVLLKRKF